MAASYKKLFKLLRSVDNSPDVGMYEHIFSQLFKEKEND